MTNTSIPAGKARIVSVYNGILTTLSRMFPGTPIHAVSENGEGWIELPEQDARNAEEVLLSAADGVRLFHVQCREPDLEDVSPA